MNSKVRNLAIAACLLCAGYFLFDHFTSHSLSLKLTRRISAELRHQMLVACLTFAKGSSKQLLSRVPDTNSKIEFFTAEMQKIYEAREELILANHRTSKEDYARALRSHREDPLVKAMEDEVIKLMSDAVIGVLPDLTVDKRAAVTFSKDITKRVYQQLIILVLENLLLTLQTLQQNDPYFDPKDNQQFKKAIRSMNVFDMKAEFLISKGLREEWGVPNDVFFKLLQGYKLVDPAFEQEADRMQAIYNRMGEKISRDPASVVKKDIENALSEVDLEPTKLLITKSLGVNEEKWVEYKNLSKSLQEEPEAMESKQSVDYGMKQFEVLQGANHTQNQLPSQSKTQQSTSQQPQPISGLEHY